MFKFFHLPTPKELGRSKSNALPIKGFSNCDSSAYTWDDWRTEVKSSYPIRYWLLEQLPTYFWAPKRHIKDAIYWFKCHFIPSHRYHILDLRQPKLKNNKPNPEYYNYGWCDSDKQILYALFNILNNFMNNEFSNFYIPPEDEIEKNENDMGGLSSDQREAGLEMLALHKWWNEDRPRKLEDAENTLDAWHEARMKNRPDQEIWWKKLNEIEAYNAAQEEEMILRLIKIRKWLWT
jgi:hypothetical protein